MLSASRSGSSVAKVGILIVALCAGCGAQPATPGVTGVQGTAQTAAGAGQAGVTTGVASAGKSGVPATSSAGTSGATSPGTQVASAAGVSGGAASAGSGGQSSVATGRAGNGSAGAAAISGAGGGGNSSQTSGCQVAPITAEMRSRYENMDEDYYQKYASANGVIVATGPKVADEAVIRYCQFLTDMVSNEKIRDAMLDDKMWFTMIDEDEQLSDLPQIDRAYGTSLNARARGLGSLTPTICAEDSIMCLPRDKWRGDCICPHEAGHTLHSSGIQRVPELSSRLTAITQAARSSGRLSNAYVWMDGNESGMMAWGVQVWYNCAINGTMGGYHSDINTRAELQEELPEFYQFLSELMPVENQYQDCYAK